MGYSAAAPPPMVTVDPPRSAPKPLPQIVTQAPWFFCPAVLGPLSRSEKKMRGGVWAGAGGPAWPIRSGRRISASSIAATHAEINFIFLFISAGKILRLHPNLRSFAQLRQILLLAAIEEPPSSTSSVPLCFKDFGLICAHLCNLRQNLFAFQFWQSPLVSHQRSHLNHLNRT